MRLYVRDTKTWKLLGWEGQTVLSLLARRFDRSGLLDDVRTGEDVAIMIGYGFPEDVAERGLKKLLKKDVWRIIDTGLFWPNFMEAQETAMSDAQRQRESRAKRRVKALLGKVATEVENIEITGDYTMEQAHSMVETAILNGVLVREECEICGDTKRIDAHHDDYSKPLKVRWLCKSCHGKLHHDVTNCDQKSQENRSCHDATAPVTPCCTVPNRTVPDLDKGITTLVPVVEQGVSTQEDLLFPSQHSDLTSEKKTRRSKKTNGAKGATTWDAYSAAYAKRYGTTPERNAKTSTLCCRVVDLLGADKAPLVAGFYPTVRTQPYLGAGHCLELLVRDYQKIATMWETGRQITQSEAREVDQLQGQGDAWKRAIEKRSAE